MAASMGRPPPRKISRLLVANRGEIAVRIISAARELSIYTIALTTPSDTSHAFNASLAEPLASAAGFLDIDGLVALARTHGVDSLHPGYGFLSESPDLARRMWDEAGVVVVGPGWDVLARTGDKLRARDLARQCGVPVLPAMDTPTSSADELRAFADSVGYPVMLKAVDGGGGRGIRLVQTPDDLDSAARLAIAESPSGHVFCERAAVSGFRHIEVQILGDTHGGVRHLWERECSIQRRYQKVVEQAPSTLPDRSFAARIIGAALRMARRIGYASLGTFEFLARCDMDAPHEFFFLEVNPRLQVEHTVTEALAGCDLVRAQLLIAQGAALDDAALGLEGVSSDPALPPPSRMHAIQCRLTAERVHSGWGLSVGRIADFNLPTGAGVRVDTALLHGHAAVVGPDFDSLLAKIVVSAVSWEAAIAKARRALADTRVIGVSTNLDALRAVAASDDFAQGRCDTTWLERELPALLREGLEASRTIDAAGFLQEDATARGSADLVGASSSAVVLRKGDAWTLTMMPAEDAEMPSGGAPAPASSSVSTLATMQPRPQPHHLKLLRVLRNEIPAALAAEVAYTTPSGPDQISTPQHFRMELAATSASSTSTMAASKHRRGDASKAGHVVIPFAGRLVEVLVDVGDVVQKGDVICVVAQMKMELEIRSARPGRVVWITEAEDGEDVAEGNLAAELEIAEEQRPKL